MFNTDTQAIATKAANYRQDVLAFFERRCNDVNTAEDLTQDVMVRFIENVESFDTERPLLPWLMTLSKNVLTNHWKSQRIRKTDDIALTDPAKTLSFDDVMSDLDDAMSFWEPRHRFVAEYRLAGLSVQDIADKLGVSVPTIKRDLAAIKPAVLAITKG